MTETGLLLEIRTTQTGIIFRLVPAGTCMVGSPEDDPFRLAGEVQRQVVLAEPIYVGKYEVTQRQWQAVMGTTPARHARAGRDAPVEQVSWEQCQAFCRKLCELEGLPEGTFRLPTDDEWEYACRAGTSTSLYGGDLTSAQGRCPNLDEVAWYLGNITRRSTAKVGLKRPNAWGLYDMHGNVAEWCQDLWRGGAVTHSHRGGSWARYAFHCRSATRAGAVGRQDETGFRLVMSARP